MFLFEEIEAILAAPRKDAGDFSQSEAIERLIPRFGWPGVRDALLGILTKQRSRADYQVAAEVIWGAVLDKRDMPADRVIALLCHRFDPRDEATENLIWSITSKLRGVDYLSTYDPRDDPRVQRELTGIRDVEGTQTRIVAGLPCHARWTIEGTSLDYDFSVARRGLRAVENDFDESDRHDWSDLLVFGECDYADGGGAQTQLCVRKSDGAVYNLDVDRDEMLYFLNSSIERFARTFGVLNEYLGNGKQLPLDLDVQVHAIDPDAYPESDWRSLIEYLTPGQ